MWLKINELQQVINKISPSKEHCPIQKLEISILALESTNGLCYQNWFMVSEYILY